jgi:hypothetical protein
MHVDNTLWKWRQKFLRNVRNLCTKPLSVRSHKTVISKYNFILRFLSCTLQSVGRQTTSNPTSCFTKRSMYFALPILCYHQKVLAPSLLSCVQHRISIPVSFVCWLLHAPCLQYNRAVPMHTCTIGSQQRVLFLNNYSLKRCRPLQNVALKVIRAMGPLLVSGRCCFYRKAGSESLVDR